MIHKKRIVFAAAVMMSVLLSACANQNTQPDASPAVQSTEHEDTSQVQNVPSDVVTTEDALSFPLGMEISSGAFTGTAYINPMISTDDVYHFPATNTVTFEPGARSFWHTHGGMVILAVDGVGYYQEDGQPAQILRPGDVVECPEGVRHWHGAAPDSWFSQIVIFDAAYTAPEGTAEESPVTDEEYENLETVECDSLTQGDDFHFQQAAEPMTTDTFSGPVYVSSLLDGENVAGAPGLHYVVFEPGAVSSWHTHEGGQILIATDGVGYHQIEGEPVQILHPGDVAFCPPGVRHWHGGSAGGAFAHIAVNTNPERPGVEWFEPVSQETIAELPAEDTASQN